MLEFLVAIISTKMLTFYGKYLYLGLNHNSISIYRIVFSKLFSLMCDTPKDGMILIYKHSPPMWFLSYIVLATELHVIVYTISYEDKAYQKTCDEEKKDIIISGKIIYKPTTITSLIS